MSAQTRARLFEPFFSTKDSHRGLGLPSVRGIVMSHGGAVKVQSESGKATSFAVLLPCSSRAAERPVADSADVALPEAADGDLTAWRGQGTVLLIEDDAAVGAFVERALCNAGLTVLRAADGEAGVELFAREAGRVDLALLDLTLPKMNGRAVLAAIRALRPAASVILCSGDPSSAQDLATDGFLAKPYSLSVLLRTVRDALERKEMRRSPPPA